MDRRIPLAAWILSLIWSAAFIWFFFAQEKKISTLQKAHNNLVDVFHKGDIFLASIMSEDLPGYIEHRKSLLSYIDYYNKKLNSDNFHKDNQGRIQFLLTEMRTLISEMDHAGFPPPEIIRDHFLKINEEIHVLSMTSLKEARLNAWFETLAIFFFLIGLGVLNYLFWFGRSSKQQARSKAKESFSLN